jgi:hypothetical protein
MKRRTIAAAALLLMVLSASTVSAEMRRISLKTVGMD